jgi:hypothetical protein
MSAIGPTMAIRFIQPTLLERPGRPFARGDTLAEFVQHYGWQRSILELIGGEINNYWVTAVILMAAAPWDESSQRGKTRQHELIESWAPQSERTAASWLDVSKVRSKIAACFDRCSKVNCG